MKALISRETATSGMPEVGTSDRTVVSHYKTFDGIRRYARQYANGKRFRIEFFTDEGFYGEPFKTEVSQ